MANFPTRPPSDRARLDEVTSQVLREWDCAAACKTLDPELFFNYPSQNKHVLAPACGSCPVAALCVRSMLGSNTQRTPLIYGFWAGINAEVISGKMLDYITAIARNTTPGATGDEVSYLATRFLMESVTDAVRTDGSGAIDDALFDAFTSALGRLGAGRLSQAVEDIMSGPESESEYTSHFIERVRSLARSGAHGAQAMA